LALPKLDIEASNDMLFTYDHAGVRKADGRKLFQEMCDSPFVVSKAHHDKLSVFVTQTRVGDVSVGGIWISGEIHIVRVPVQELSQVSHGLTVAVPSERRSASLCVNFVGMSNEQWGTIFGIKTIVLWESGKWPT
jgi:hypothetical protein